MRLRAKKKKQNNFCESNKSPYQYINYKQRIIQLMNTFHANHEEAAIINNVYEAKMLSICSEII